MLTLLKCRHFHASQAFVFVALWMPGSVVITLKSASGNQCTIPLFLMSFCFTNHDHGNGKPALLFMLDVLRLIHNTHQNLLGNLWWFVSHSLILCQTV